MKDHKSSNEELVRDYLKNYEISVKKQNKCKYCQTWQDIYTSGEVLYEKLNEELGYFRYDYHNKDIDNSCNGYSKKTVHTNYGDMDVAVPKDRNFHDRQILLAVVKNDDVFLDIKGNCASWSSRFRRAISFRSTEE